MILLALLVWTRRQGFRSVLPQVLADEQSLLRATLYLVLPTCCLSSFKRATHTAYLFQQESLVLEGRRLPRRHGRCPWQCRTENVAVIGEGAITQVS